VGVGNKGRVGSLRPKRPKAIFKTQAVIMAL
jgi:hypothetical protein